MPLHEMMAGANLFVLSHSIAAIAFLLLCALTVTSWRRGPLGGWLIGASAATALWASYAVYQGPPTLDESGALGLFDLIRSSGWIVFLVGVLMKSWQGSASTPLRPMLPVVVVLCGATILYEAAALWPAMGVFDLAGHDVALYGRLLIAVLGLLLVENLFRNTREEHRWGIKYLCLGIGSLFSYDIFLYAQEMLLQHPSDSLLAARGLTNAVVVPLIAVSVARNPSWSIDLAVSRRFVFQSASLFGAGTYLLVMSAAGFYVQRFGGEWGPAIQTMFLFASVIMLLVVGFSGSSRAWLRVFIAKHFFTYRFDYRHEWLRFIGTISSLDRGGIHERVIKAVAAIVDSPRGALFVTKGGERFSLLGCWNYRMQSDDFAADPSFIEMLELQQWVVDLDEYASAPARYRHAVLPERLTQAPKAWLIVPLFHHQQLTGILLLTQPLAPRRMNWEDFELLKTVGRQSASYLAEYETARNVFLFSIGRIPTVRRV